MQDVNLPNFVAEVQAYNAAIKREVEFNPNIKDGRGTEGLAINKTNWANTIEKPPFECIFRVGCGITFTFGGLKIDGKRPGFSISRICPLPGPLCGRRTCRRPLLLQLPRQHGPGCRRRVRTHRRTRGRTGPAVAAEATGTDGRGMSSKTAELQRLIHRQGKVLAVLHPPTAALALLGDARGRLRGRLRRNGRRCWRLYRHGRCRHDRVLSECACRSLGVDRRQRGIPIIMDGDTGHGAVS